MAILKFEPQEADIVALDIDTLVPTQDPGSIRWTVAQSFFEKSKICADEGAENASHIFRLLGGALSMHSTPFAPQPYGPMMQTKEGRSLSLEDIGANDVPALKFASQLSHNPWVKSRFGDAALSCGIKGASSDYLLGREVVIAYLDFLESCFLKDTAVHGLEECHRVLTLLWVYCKKEPDIWDRAWLLIRRQILESLTLRHPGIAFPLCREVITRRKILRGEIVLEVEKVADQLAAEGAHYEASRYYQMSAELWQSIADRNRTREAFLSQAKALANAALQTEGTAQAMVGGNWMQIAILILQRNRAPKETIELHKSQLSQLNLSSLDSFGHFEHSTDATERVKQIHETIVGPSYLDCLMQLSFLVSDFIDPAKLREDVLKSARDHPISHLFATQHIDSDGNVVANRRAFDQTDEDSILQEMFHHAKSFELNFRAQLLISTSTGILFNQLNPPFNATLELVEASPTIPLGIKQTVARGLHAGISDDWIAAGVYLIPAVEPLIRFHLNSAGINTKLHREDGTQEELTLSGLLAHSGCKECLGESLLFELRALLTEPVGYNLRNQYAHGLLTDRGLYSTGTLNLWWLIWRLSLFPWAPGFIERHRNQAKAINSPSEG